MTCDTPHGSHPVNHLRRWLDQRLPADRYPVGGRPVLDPFHGTAFFTAGTGLIVDDPAAASPPPWPQPGEGVAFVGNHLDSVSNFLKRRSRNLPHGGPASTMDTWKGVYQLLDLANVDASRCFFTNCYVGLVEGSAVGRHPAADDSAFRALCWEFLLLQLQELQPAAVAVLGGHARDFLVDHLPELRRWRNRPVTRMDPTDSDAVIKVTLPRIGPVVFTVLVHPSNYVAKPHFMKKWRGVSDAGVEADLLNRALATAS